MRSCSYWNSTWKSAWHVWSRCYVCKSITLSVLFHILHVPTQQKCYCFSNMLPCTVSTKALASPFAWNAQHPQLLIQVYFILHCLMEAFHCPPASPGLHMRRALHLEYSDIKWGLSLISRVLSTVAWNKRYLLHQHYFSQRAWKDGCSSVPTWVVHYTVLLNGGYVASCYCALLFPPHRSCVSPWQ